MTVPDFHCPACGVLSSIIISPEQALCTNDENCHILAFNPSDPDPFKKTPHFIDLSDIGAVLEPE